MYDLATLHQHQHALPANLFRQCCLDADGKPMPDEELASDDELPDVDLWAALDHAAVGLTPLGPGSLLITSADDAEFVRERLPEECAQSASLIRAVFAPEDPKVAAPRMGDVLVVAAAPGVALAYRVHVTHDDLPDDLKAPGEVSLALLDDLSVVDAQPEA